MAKSALSEYPINDIRTHELEGRADMAAIQDALREVSGRRSVPNVFVGGRSIGGGDEVSDLHRSGRLEEVLRSAGAL